jgi:hypothetical protein
MDPWINQRWGQVHIDTYSKNPAEWTHPLSPCTSHGEKKKDDTRSSVSQQAWYVNFSAKNHWISWIKFSRKTFSRGTSNLKYVIHERVVYCADETPQCFQSSKTMTFVGRCDIQKCTRHDNNPGTRKYSQCEFYIVWERFREKKNPTFHNHTPFQNH